MSRYHLIAVAAAATLLGLSSQGRAEVVRFRYAATNPCSSAVLVPGPNGAPGERSAWVGGPIEPFCRQPQATHVVTFRHPYTCQNINVPFTFPMGTPRLEHRFERIVYNYTAYQITAHFLPDGSVEVIYNSGALRPMVFQ